LIPNSASAVTFFLNHLLILWLACNTLKTLGLRADSERLWPLFGHTLP